MFGVPKFTVNIYPGHPNLSNFTNGPSTCFVIYSLVHHSPLMSLILIHSFLSHWLVISHHYPLVPHCLNHIYMLLSYAIELHFNPINLFFAHPNLCKLRPWSWCYMVMMVVRHSLPIIELSHGKWMEQRGIRGELGDSNTSKGAD
jgi:hypothetical protein